MRDQPAVSMAGAHSWRSHRLASSDRAGIMSVLVRKRADSIWNASKKRELIACSGRQQPPAPSCRATALECTQKGTHHVQAPADEGQSSKVKHDVQERQR